MAYNKWDVVNNTAKSTNGIKIVNGVLSYGSVTLSPLSENANDDLLNKTKLTEFINNSINHFTIGSVNYKSYNSLIGAIVKYSSVTSFKYPEIRYVPKDILDTVNEMISNYNLVNYDTLKFVASNAPVDEVNLDLYDKCRSQVRLPDGYRWDLAIVYWRGLISGDIIGGHAIIRFADETYTNVRCSSSTNFQLILQKVLGHRYLKIMSNSDEELAIINVKLLKHTNPAQKLDNMLVTEETQTFLTDEREKILILE